MAGMTELLYLRDSYLREFKAKVVSVEENRVVLDRTAFYPAGGGQPSDRGWLEWDGGRAEVVDVVKRGGEVYHVLEGGVPEPGAEVKGTLDWELRYRHMRYHTALHILAGAVYHLFGSTITGSQIRSEKARIDFTLEDLSRERVEAIEREANKIVEEGRPVHVRFIPREEALKNPQLIRIRPDLIPDIPVLRIIEIEGFDAQLDGGTHVANTREVGKIKIVKTINKGKHNRRLEIVLEEG